MKDGHRGTERAWSIPGGLGGGRPSGGCVLRSDASWGAPVQMWRGSGEGHTWLGAGPGQGQCGQRPEPWGPAASCGVGGMELKDPPALAGGPSENPWGAEKVISLLRMLPEEQEAQRLSNGRHDEVMSLAQLATRSRVRSPCGPLFGRFCKEAAHCFRASQAALRLRIRLPVQERGSIPGS